MNSRGIDRESRDDNREDEREKRKIGHSTKKEEKGI